MERDLSGLSDVLHDLKTYFQKDKRIMLVYIVDSYG